MADKKTFSVSDFRGALRDRTFLPRLAKGLRDRIGANAAAIAEMRRLEKGSMMGDAHFEPGKHEPSEAGVQEHLEPGLDEQFAMNPPAHPEAQNPVGSGAGVPPGELGAAPTMDPCAFCQGPDCPGTCGARSAITSLIPLTGILGKTEPPPGFDGQAMRALEGRFGAERALQVAWGAHARMRKGETPAGPVPDGGLQMAEKNPGHTGDPTKQQPTPPVRGAKLAPDKVKKPPAGGSGGLSAPRANPLGKADVPAAKPPSGKVPGQGKPPMSSSTSKPGIAKDEESPPMRARCKHCGGRLGAQDPGDTCGTCKYTKNQDRALGKAAIPATGAQKPAVPAAKPPAAAGPKPPPTTPPGHRLAQGPVPAAVAPAKPPPAPGPKLPTTPYK